MVHIRRHLDSDTLYLPEVAPMIGKDVEIIVVEEPSDEALDQDLTPFFELAGNVDLDYDAVSDLRRISIL